MRQEPHGKRSQRPFWVHFWDVFDAYIYVVIAGSWKQISANFIFFLAGLQAIQKTVIEASIIDCKSNIRRFWTITHAANHLNQTGHAQQAEAEARTVADETAGDVAVAPAGADMTVPAAHLQNVPLTKQLSGP